MIAFQVCMKKGAAEGEHIEGDMPEGRRAGGRHSRRPRGGA